MNTLPQREGVLVSPDKRLSEEQIKLVDSVSRELLEDPGILCYNQRAVELFRQAGATIEDAEDCQRVRISSSLLDQALNSAPSKITLGARDPENRLILDADEPRVRFGSGSETNFWLETEFEGKEPKFKQVQGSIELLRQAAHLCDNLENLDFFIRCVNIQDKEVTAENKDVNKFIGSLNNIGKHVQAGLTSLDALDEIIKIGRIVAGGEKEFEENPVLSFITCVIKSPFQMVDDTAEKMIEIARRRVPVVISSCPMGGATGPFDEFGMVAQINAELLAGVVLNQLASPGAPVLYGAVPVRSRLDNLNDLYGAPEFVHYNLDCAQMARFYHLPCYSTAGVGDTTEPGIQATAEKLTTLMTVPRNGAQYIHYAFGLLDRTNIFSPEQAVMDDAHIGIVKRILRDAPVAADDKDSVLSAIREVMETPHKTYIYNLPLPSEDEGIYVCYPLENSEGGALRAAQEKYREIMEKPRNTLPEETISRLKNEIPGILPETLA